MRFSHLFTIFWLACVLLISPAQAQPEPVKFGKLDIKEFDDKSFAADTTAEAVVMADYGRSHFEYVQNEFRVVFDRITRIKILKKSGYKWATVEIPLFKRNSDVEQVTSLKGMTYNLVNGQLQKEKLENSAMFTEQKSANWTARKFTLPNVREGSVIEYSYSVSSDFYHNFQNWEFQETIPVRWSEYRVSLPEYFDYKIAMQGYVPLEISEQNAGSTQFTVTDKSGGRTETTTVTPQTQTYRWVMKDVPAFRNEPFMTTAQDYIAQVNFELRGLKFPGSAYQNVTGTWTKVNTELLADENFGVPINHTNFLKNELVEIVAKHAEPLARAAAIHQLVKASIQYNGQDRLYSSGPLRKAYETHTGNSADINLLLIGLLREAGLKVTPVIISTRNHGRIDEYNPMVSRFNYVLAAVSLPGQSQPILLDATQRQAAFGMLPERCLNVRGVLVTEEKLEDPWLTVESAQRYVHFQSAQLTLDAQGGMKGRIHDEHNGYQGLNVRKKIQEDGEKKYIENTYLHDHGTWTIASYKLQQLQEVSKPIAVDLDVTIPGESETAGAIYLNPLQQLGESHNPFRSEQRLFPVDFGAPRDETHMLTIQIPADYEVDELPKNALVTLANNGGRFQYAVVPTAGGLQIVSRISFNRASYSAEEYADLREFYNLIIAKHAEHIVLKKKS